ncbi:MAG: SPFH domain-containing protein [Halobacteriota archaeon]
MAFKWKKDLDDIARVIPKKNVKGFFSKSITLSPNEKAVMIRNGEVDNVIDSGKMRVGGLLKPGNIRKDVDVALIDTSFKELRWGVPALWTRDGQEVGCGGILRFRINDAKKFFGMIFSYTVAEKNGERNLSIFDIYERLESETITRVLEPEVHGEDIESLYGNRDLQLRMENELEMQLKDTLMFWGLELVKYTCEWDFGDYAVVRKGRSGFQISEELKEMNVLQKEGDIERESRVGVAATRAGFAEDTVRAGYYRTEEEKDALHRARLSQIENEADAVEAKQAIGTFSQWKQANIGARRADLELDEDMNDRKHSRDMEYLGNVMEKGGSDVAKVIAQGREFRNMSPEQLEALAKMKEAESIAKEDKVRFMMEVEDRERDDSYRRKELDAEMMGAAQPRRSPGVKKCHGCGSTVPAGAHFCGQCGTKLE